MTKTQIQNKEVPLFKLVAWFRSLGFGIYLKFDAWALVLEYRSFAVK